MPSAIKCELRLYADHYVVIFTDKYISIINDQVNRELNSLCEWFANSKLIIHLGEDKTKSILFSRNEIKR